LRLRNDTRISSGNYWTGPVEPGWLASEIGVLVRNARQQFPLGLLLARRRMIKRPVQTTAQGLVAGRIVRVQGTIGFGPPGQRCTSADLELVRAVEGGGDLPDFWLHLADGSSVSIAARDAGREGRLAVLDPWEDRQSFVVCDASTPALFRQSRFRDGRPAEACGLAVQMIDPDQGDPWQRAVGVGWRLTAAARPLTIRFGA
jgi:hypothetical protein